MNSKLYKSYQVSLDSSKYSIIVGRDILFDEILNKLNGNTKNNKVMLVCDIFFQDNICKNLKEMLADNGYEVYLYPMSSGKHNKTINEAINIYELLEQAEFSRDSTLIALGGGVIGDLSGFVASTYLRGINYITVPTTLMAMIDSSIGGKVAINFRKTTNAIGNYYHPMLNVVDLEFIKTLPQRDFKSGLAEIIKCAIIANGDLFDYLKLNNKSILNQDEDSLLYVMLRAIEVKLDYVAGDVREQGKRLKLNYGHTMGHSVEISTDILEEVYRHGEGVSLGMMGAAFLAKNYFKQNDDIFIKHEEILQDYGLPVRVDSKKINFDRDSLLKECIKNIYKDKKRKNNKLRFVLPKKIGSCGVYADVPDALVEEAFNYLVRG